MESSAPNRPLADEVRKKKQKQRIIGFVAMGIGGLLIIVGVVFAFIALRGPNTAEIYNKAVGDFFAATSLTYKGQGKVDLLLSTATDGVQRDGTVKFNFAYGGVVESSKDGYGDGTHRVRISGALQSGNFAWPTDIEADVRVVDSSLYLHLLSFPSTSDLDPDLFRSYWVKVDLAEVAKELSLSGVLAAQEGYGSFGGQTSDFAFNTMLQKYAPFAALDAPTEENLLGVEAYHFTLRTDPDKELEFVSALYRKYIGAELVLGDPERLRLRDALAKIGVEIWVDKESGALLQVALKGDIDDDVVRVHAKGLIDIVIGLSALNVPAKTEAPSPTLTLEEVKVRMEDYKAIKAVRQGDRVKLDRLGQVMLALDAFAGAKGKYPLLLSELYKAGVLATSTIAEDTLKQYVYGAYSSTTALTKTTRCTTRSVACPFFHIGINLDDPENPELVNDHDLVSDIQGADTRGCAGEPNVACFDIGKAFSLAATPTNIVASSTPK
jgi:hypothetical protein